MAMLKAGTRMRSAVCATEVMVIQAPEADCDLRCGGAPMVALDEAPPAGQTLNGEAAAGTQIGKRYVDEDGHLELLCTKPGEGSLGVGATLLTIKGAKPLPASD